VSASPSRLGLIALLTASTVSSLGSRVSVVAIPWLVLVTTGSPADMGLVVGATMIPYLAASVFGTPLADRLGLRATAITADTVSMITTAVIAASPRIGLPTILAMVAISGMIRGVGDRTKHVLLRPAAETAGVPMPRVTAIYDGLDNGATLVGMPVGGLLIVWFGAQGAVWVDSVSYAASALIFATLVTAGREPKQESKPAEPYLRALRAGARQLGSDRLLLSMLAMVFFANMVNQATTTVFIPLWVSDVLHSPAALGTILGAFAAGAVVGNLVFTALAVKLTRYVVFAVCLAISGAPRLFVLGSSHNLGVVLAVTFLCGLAMSAVNPILGATLYGRVPSDLQTRVFGLVAAVAYAGFPVGGLLAGWSVSGFGLTAPILVGGVVYLAATLLPLLRYRGMSLVPAEVREEEMTEGPAKP
jgi:MFS family permease